MSSPNWGVLWPLNTWCIDQPNNLAWNPTSRRTIFLWQLDLSIVVYFFQIQWLISLVKITVYKFWYSFIGFHTPVKLTLIRHYKIGNGLITNIGLFLSLIIAQIEALIWIFLLDVNVLTFRWTWRSKTLLFTSKCK